MVKYGIFKFEKKDTFVLIAGVTGMIGIFKYHLLLGTLTLICGIISKYMRSKYWTWVVFASFLIYIIYIIKTFWPN